MTTGALMRERIVIQHTAELSSDEIQSQRAKFEDDGWTAVIAKQRPDLAGRSGWKAYEWSGIRDEIRTTLEDISVPSYDVDPAELHDALAKDYGLANFEVVDYTDPVVNEDGYLIHTLTIRSNKTRP